MKLLLELLQILKVIKLTLEAELFSLDGSERFHLKSFKSIDKAEELGIEMGKTLKKMSNNSYKK